MPAFCLVLLPCEFCHISTGKESPLLICQLKMSGMIDPQIFEHLKAKIDEETQAKDELNQIVQRLERDVSYTQGVLSRVHSTPRSSYSSLLPQVEASIKTEIDDMTALSNAASKHPYYKCAFFPFLSHHSESR